MENIVSDLIEQFPSSAKGNPDTAAESAGEQEAIKQQIQQQMQEQHRKKMELIISQSTRKKCRCGSEFFDNVTVQMDVPSKISGTGKDEILILPALLCHKCGEELTPNKITP